MGYMDKRALLSDAQSLAISVGTASSTYNFDYGPSVNYNGTDSIYADLGTGTPLWAHVKIGTACSDTAGTLLATIEDCSDNAAYSALITSDTVASTSLTAGLEMINTPLPADAKRYIRVKFTVGTADLTTGTVDAWIDQNPS